MTRKLEGWEKRMSIVEFLDARIEFAKKMSKEANRQNQPALRDEYYEIRSELELVKELILHKRAKIVAVQRKERQGLARLYDGEIESARQFETAIAIYDSVLAMIGKSSEQ